MQVPEMPPQIQKVAPRFCMRCRRLLDVPFFDPQPGLLTGTTILKAGKFGVCVNDKCTFVGVLVMKWLEPKEKPQEQKEG